MKKPDYISIQLPGAKVLYLRPMKGYFKKLIGKTIELSFGEQRTRKVFKYTVSDAHADFNYYESKKPKDFRIILKREVEKAE